MSSEPPLNDACSERGRQPGRSSATHPASEMLRAYDDGELGLWTAWRLARHLAGCSSCRDELDRQRRLARHVAGLLAPLALDIDSREGWRRLRSTRAPGTAREISQMTGSPARVPALPRVAIGVAALGTILLPAWLLFLRGENETSVAPSQPRNGMAAARDNATVQDLCCWDLDGGGPSDDGLVTVSRPGERVERVLVYDDRDGTRSFSSGDLVRWRSEAPRRLDGESSGA